MGAGRWDATDWDAYRTTTIGKTSAQIYASTAMPTDLDPKNIKIRESRDSLENPTSTPMMVGVDVTGSMGMISDYIARTGLGVLFEEMLKRKPISDPHMMFLGIGDVDCDQSPLQASQFEADSRIIEQLTTIHIEKGGGGNGWESYNLPWYFAKNFTVTDSMEKRAKKGYLFTIGDEPQPTALTASQISKVFGDRHEPLAPISNRQLVDLASESYHVFHLHITESSTGKACMSASPYGRTGSSTAPIDDWKALLGGNLLVVNDHKRIAEIIISAIQITEGLEKEEVINSWDASARPVLEVALENITSLKPVVPVISGGIARFS